MPVVDLTVVGGDDDPSLAQRVADAVGEALGAEPGRSWLTLRRVRESDYAENGSTLGGAPPVFVTVTLRELPDARERGMIASSLAMAAGAALGRPADRVHVFFAAEGAWRVAFGGALVEGERRRHDSGAPWEAVVGYSRAVRAGAHVYVTGTTATLPGGGQVEGDAYAQALQAMTNVVSALAAVGARVDDVVRTRMFVTDIAGDWRAVGRAHAEVFGAVRPATTMVEVRALIEPWMRVEVEADAVLR